MFTSFSSLRSKLPSVLCRTNVTMGSATLPLLRSRRYFLRMLFAPLRSALIRFPQSQMYKPRVLRLFLSITPHLQQVCDVYLSLICSVLQISRYRLDALRFARGDASGADASNRRRLLLRTTPSTVQPLSPQATVNQLVKEDIRIRYG